MSPLKIRLSLLLVLCIHCVLGQQNLQPEQAQWLQQCDSILTLSEAQHQSILQILIDFQAKATEWENRKLDNNRSDRDPIEWEKTDLQLQAEKKEMRKQKEDQIIAVLSPPQIEIYHQSIAPQKPSVLHMGLKHDRANCIVCVKPTSP
jgi:hypothetical protein